MLQQEIFEYLQGLGFDGIIDNSVSVCMHLPLDSKVKSYNSTLNVNASINHKKVDIELSIYNKEIPIVLEQSFDDFEHFKTILEGNRLFVRLKTAQGL